MAAADAQWPDEDYLEDPFQAHELDTLTDSVDEYDQSARWVIVNGRRFEYEHRTTGQVHVGYYEEATGLFTALNSAEDKIITHFRPEDPDYPQTLPNSTY